MADIYETRRLNLVYLIEIYGGKITKLNEALGRKKYDGTLNQIKNKTKTPTASNPRRMGAEVARSIESKLRLPPGWMDLEHDKSDREVIKESSSFLKNSVYKIPFYSDKGVEPSKELYKLFEGEMKLNDFFIKTTLRPTSEENLRLITISDNSLTPIFREGDIVIIDVGINSFTRDGWYFIKLGEQKLIRKISASYSGGYIVGTPLTEEKIDELNKITILAQALFVYSGTSL